MNIAEPSHSASDAATEAPCISGGHRAGGPASWVATSVRGRGVWTSLGLIGVGLFFIILRSRNYDAPLIRDEGEFAYAARLVRHGIPPYEHSFLQKPPMVVYAYALADIIAPNLFWFPRILADLSVALATGLLGWIVRLEFGKGLAMPAMWLLTPMLLLPSLNASTALTEMFMLLPLLATLGLYVRNRRRHSGPGSWFFAGALAALTLLHKYTAFPLIGVIVCSWAFEEQRGGRPISEVCRLCLCALAGALVAAATALGFFVASDGGKHLWECTVQFNRFYASSSNFGLSNIWTLFKGLWSCWQILFLFPVILLFHRPPRAGFWAVMFVAAVLSTGGSAYGQYYILVTPFWAVLVVAAIKVLADFGVQRLDWSKEWTIGGMTAGTVVLVCLPGVAAIWASQRGADLAGFSPLNPFPESVLVGRRVEQLTSPRDYVLVAGSEPQILCYAHRLSPTRFIVVYPLMIPSPLAEPFQREAIQDLRRNPPALVVEARSNTSWLVQAGTPPEFLKFLHKTLAEDYEQVGGYVLDGPGRGWREPLLAEDAFHCSLVLFRRKAQPGSLSPGAAQSRGSSGSSNL